jgi:uncharacterized membrane protein
MHFPGWHPMVVHFPLALVITGTSSLAASRLLPRADHAAALATVGTWNLCLGAVAAMFALGTGLAAAVGLQVQASAHQAISVHLKWAIFTSLVLVMLAVWRGAGNAQDSRPSWLFLTLLLGATAALTVTGYRGGVNVYRFGVGVHAAPTCTPRNL